MWGGAGVCCVCSVCASPRRPRSIGPPKLHISSLWVSGMSLGPASLTPEDLGGEIFSCVLPTPSGPPTQLQPDTRREGGSQNSLAGRGGDRRLTACPGAELWDPRDTSQPRVDSRL